MKSKEVVIERGEDEAVTLKVKTGAFIFGSSVMSTSEELTITIKNDGLVIQGLDQAQKQETYLVVENGIVTVKKSR